MNELVSVIVPVYKTEKYLNHCINSIVGQTYNNLEIILVDDGSPDRCPAICDLWKEKDERIKVFHQVNAGGGQARNLALDKSKGKFVIFVDSDDYIAPFMIEFLYKQFQDDVDIVECGYCITHNDNAEFDEESEGYRWESFGAEEAVLENIKDRMFRQIIWNKMYRKSVVGDVRFPVRKNIDDEFWTYQVLGNARKVIYTNKVLYAYRQQENSVMHSLNAVRRFQALEAKLQRHEYICKYMPALKNESICNIWFTCLYQGQLLLINSNKDIWKELTEILKKYPIRNYLNSMSGKEKIWLSMADKSFYWTCYIRNLFKIGL
jgi:glycosyltransferase involved in cell wall biosynthesis